MNTNLSSTQQNSKDYLKSTLNDLNKGTLLFLENQKHHNVENYCIITSHLSYNLSKSLDDHLYFLKTIMNLKEYNAYIYYHNSTNKWYIQLENEQIKTNSIPISHIIKP